jgi:preprotein translocase subunit SecE
MNWFQRAKTFLAEVRSELKRTSWPSWKEVRGTTTVVIVTVFIFALFLWVVDTILFHMVTWVFNQSAG